MNLKHLYQYAGKIKTDPLTFPFHKKYHLSKTSLGNTLKQLSIQHLVALISPLFLYLLNP